MQVKIFTLPISDDGTAQAELNKFIQHHKILELRQEFFQNKNDAAWCLCVNYLKTNTAASYAKPVKKDYKALLTEVQFEVFARLRDIRKVIAADDAVPAYAVITGAELAEMAKLEVLTKPNVKGISGISDKRLEKYGKNLMEQYFTARRHETISSSH